MEPDGTSLLSALAPRSRQAAPCMRTLLCAFDDRQTGLRAMSRLVCAGVPRDDVHLQEPPTAYADDGVASVEPDEACDAPPGGLLSRLGRWLAGPPVPGAAGTYRDAVRRHSTVVVVHVSDDAQAARARALMATAGAFDIECRS